MNNNLDWLNSLVGDLYQLNDSELEIIEFYSSGESDEEALSRINEIHRLVNDLEETLIDEQEKVVAS